MDFLIHFRIESPETAKAFRASLQAMDALVYTGEGSFLVSHNNMGKKGLIARLQQDLLSAEWAIDDFLNLYFSESGHTLNCWQMKRIGRIRMIKMNKEHPYFRY